VAVSFGAPLAVPNATTANTAKTTPVSGARRLRRFSTILRVPETQFVLYHAAAFVFVDESSELVSALNTVENDDGL